MDSSDVYLLEQLDYKGEFSIVHGDFSMRELEEVNDSIVIRVGDFEHISSVGISNDMNKVSLVVSEISDELNEYINSLPNPEILEITIGDYEAVEHD